MGKPRNIFFFATNQQNLQLSLILFCVNYMKKHLHHADNLLLLYLCTDVIDHTYNYDTR